MLEFNEYLEKAPKSFVGKLKQRTALAQTGLLSHQKILDEVKLWGTQKERIELLLEFLTPLQAKVLTSIYLSGQSGVETNRLAKSLNKEERESLKTELQFLKFHLLIFRSEAPHMRWYGFVDFNELVLQKMASGESRCSDSEGADALDHSFKAALQILALSVELHHTPRAPKQSGVLNERHFNVYLQRFGQLKHLSEQAWEEILSFSQHYGQVLNLIGTKNEKVWGIVNGELKDQSLPHFQLELIDIWCDKHLSSPRIYLKKILSHCATDKFSVAQFVNLFMFCIDEDFVVLADRTLDWNEIPEPFRELVWLGVFQIEYHKDRILNVSLGQAAQMWLNPQEIPKSSFMSTPDFEVFLPIHSNIRHFLGFELLAKGGGDDMVVKYKIDRARLVLSLQQGLDVEQMESFLASLDLPKLVTENIRSWMDSVSGSVITQGILLEVKNESIRNTLLQMKDSDLWCERVLPEFGFIIRSAYIQEVQKLLEGFSLYPPRFEQYLENLRPVKKCADLPNKYTLPVTVEYSSLDEPEEQIKTRKELSRYGNKFKDLTYIEKLRLMEYAILTEQKIEIEWHGVVPKTIILQPFKVATKTSPIQLVGVNLNDSENVQIPVEEIHQVRLWDGP